MDVIQVGGNNMNINDRLQLLYTIEQAAFELVNKISKELPKGTIVRVRERNYESGEIEELLLTVNRVTYYESELTIECKSVDGQTYFYDTGVDIEVIR